MHEVLALSIGEVSYDEYVLGTKRSESSKGHTRRLSVIFTYILIYLDWKEKVFARMHRLITFSTTLMTRTMFESYMLVMKISFEKGFPLPRKPPML